MNGWENLTVLLRARKPWVHATLFCNEGIGDGNETWLWSHTLAIWPKIWLCPTHSRPKKIGQGFRCSPTGELFLVPHLQDLFRKHIRTFWERAINLSILRVFRPRSHIPESMFRPRSHNLAYRVHVRKNISKKWFSGILLGCLRPGYSSLCVSQ